jgi:hypothetical protein
MEISDSLYSHYAPNPIGKLLFTCQANKQDEGDVTVAIYEKCLIESSIRSKSYLILDFDVKFAFQATPPTITFEKN